MRTIRASEIGTYVFCQRAWWYLKSGQPSENTGEIAAGNEIHTSHRRQIWQIGCLQGIAVMLLLVSLALVVTFLMESLF